VPDPLAELQAREFLVRRVERLRGEVEKATGSKPGDG